MESITACAKLSLINKPKTLISNCQKILVKTILLKTQNEKRNAVYLVGNKYHIKIELDNKFSAPTQRIRKLKNHLPKSKFQKITPQNFQNYSISSSTKSKRTPKTTSWGTYKKAHKLCGPNSNLTNSFCSQNRPNNRTWKWSINQSKKKLPNAKHQFTHAIHFLIN